MTAIRHRVPWLTLSVLAVTGVVTACQFVWSALIPTLERSPAMLDGEPWRFFTTWLVHPDGWTQIVVNFWALLVAGALVEREIGRLAWGAAFITGGLAGEVAGIFWQPVGGGDSVAVLGLVGLLAVFQLTRLKLSMFRRLVWPGVATVGVIFLCVHKDIHGPAILAGAIGGLGAWFLAPMGVARPRDSQ